MEGRGSTGELSRLGLSSCFNFLLAIQFTYINLAFSPAPDDTVSNLYKVRVPIFHRLLCIN